MVRHAGGTDVLEYVELCLPEILELDREKTVF